MIVKRIVKIIVSLAIAVFVAFLTGWHGLKATDYQLELTQIKSAYELSSQSRNLFNQAFYSFQLSALTGRQDDVENADRAFDKALTKDLLSADLYLLHAAYNLKLHRLQAAKMDLEKLAFLDDAKVEVLKAEIAVQEGKYSNAAASYQAIIETNRTWDNLSRLAYLQAKFGAYETADYLYQAAEEEISAKDMRSYAWVKLQRGYIALSRGQADKAWRHYRQADQAYSGYWLTQDYIAEWLATQRKFDEAISLYKQMAFCTRKPEIYQSLGDLYLFIGKPELAQSWHDKALVHYLDSVNRGDVQYYHHLSSFYADARQDGAEAVKWARRDLQLRQNVMTQDALAWALFRNGQHVEAVEAINNALAFNWQDAHVYFHAGMIYLAAGLTEAGQRYLQQAVQINPHYDAFHVHR
ncbi:MAG: hypothetical protein HOP23_13985 [Methylococcaceae bacterium]|nr:hypothetical protein [Methylococcaceae bacterium]